MRTVVLTADLRARLEAAFGETGRCRLAALPYSAAAFLALALRDACRRAAIVVGDSPRAAEDLHRNLLALADTRAADVLLYPPWDSIPGKRGEAPAETVGERLRVLDRLARARGGAGAPPVIVSCIQALMQRTFAPAALADHRLRLAPGAAGDPLALAARLEQAGYALEADVQERGQAAVRGGLLDAWSPDAAHPVRIEFVGDAVETLRSFDPASQRSVAPLDEALFYPAAEWRLLRTAPAARALFSDHLPAAPIFLWAELLTGAGAASSPAAAGIRHHAALYQDACAEAGAGDLAVSFAEAWRAADALPGAWHGLPAPLVEGEATDWPPAAPRLDLGFRDPGGIGAPRREALAPDVFAEQRRRWFEGLAERARAGLRVHVFFYTTGSLERFRELHPGLPFRLHTGLLSDGFVHEALRLAVLAESTLLGRPKLLPDSARAAARAGRAGRAAARAAGETITDWTRLEPGDLVVHLDHGIGRYLGLQEIVFDGRRQETLAIEYADNAKLYVPTSQAQLLSRYAGVGKHAPPLHRLGGTRWAREKDAAERAVQDLAAGLLETQALREAAPGFAFAADTPWQHEFEASFPYQETEDQDRAIRDTKRDMESPRPMDRLICGDVGYGKTEVALRAAFKCALNGKQTALLAPTTVLAQQHFDVFAERLAAYPVRLELLCRFRSPAEQATALRGLADGTVDIVIGTHRLLQPDVRFRDLGLVVIDEEQRFGVAHKERFKHLQQLVDVLTLTATPIPRTLYLSLTGAREISVIQTSPRARQPIETVVARNEDALVRAAILRELNRGGQVYYLHNRVLTIERVRERLARLVPEARLAVGHGQMPTGALASVMRAFARGDTDLLLCTTIIESGLDIPNVNTIVIDRADRFGIADLYQLRGRVGRSSRQAYAYLLMPVHGPLLDAARRRLQAILEHRDLGAGFRLALRDLEIRGAGNLLGAEQSGHIAAVGFDLYCQLLRRAVARLQAGGADPAAAAPVRLAPVEIRLDFLDLSAQAPDPARAAFLPPAYVDDERLRLEVYRRIAGAAGAADLDALRAEFRDRFGPVPAPLERLLKVAGLRLAAAARGIVSVTAADGKVMLERGGQPLQLDGRYPRLRAATADACLDDLRQWLERVGPDGFIMPA